MSLAVPRARRAACSVAAVWLAWSATQHAQLEPPPAMLVSETAPPGIDRGLRASDPPRAPRTDLSGEPFLRGSVIVRFRPGTLPSAQRAILAQVAGTAERPPSYANFDIVAIDEDVDPETAAARLDAQPDVEYAQARYRVYPRFVPNDPMYPRQWNYPAIDMERA